MLEFLSYCTIITQFYVLAITCPDEGWLWCNNKEVEECWITVLSCWQSQSIGRLFDVATISAHDVLRRPATWSVQFIIILKRLRRGHICRSFQNLSGYQFHVQDLKNMRRLRLGLPNRVNSRYYLLLLNGVNAN